MCVPGAEDVTAVKCSASKSPYAAVGVDIEERNSDASVQGGGRAMNGNNTVDARASEPTCG